MEKRELEGVEYRAEFERQQFELYEARRLAEETSANAIIAAAVAVAALVLADYGRKGHPDWGWLVAALLALLWTLVFALITRFVSWETPHLVGGKEFAPGMVRPSDLVDQTLKDVRDPRDECGSDLRKRATAHWRARASSAHDLSKLKGRRLRWSLWGFIGPLVYFAIRLAG